MKHVGLNVAADTLMTLAYVGVKGGMVIVSADDPSLFSSQNEQDNRYYAKMAGLPMLEPDSPRGGQGDDPGGLRPLGGAGAAGAAAHHHPGEPYPGPRDPGGTTAPAGAGQASIRTPSAR